MDKDYLKSLNGSPFIDEGLWDRIKSFAGFGKPPESPSPETPKSPTPEENKTAQYINEVIKKTMDIIINAVKSDSWRSAPYFNNPLPTSYNDPAWDDAKKKHWGATTFDMPSVEKGKRGIEGDEPGGKEAQPEPPLDDAGGFLYKFHANFNKSRNFIVPVGDPFKVNYKGKEKEFQVYWECHGHGGSKHSFVNSIILQPKGEGENTPITLFQFWDDSADSRTEEGKNFSVKKLLNPKNPKLAKYYKGDVVTENNFQRALMATVNRKAMEFKATKQDKSIKGAIKHFVPIPNAATGVTQEDANEIEAEVKPLIFQAVKEFRAKGKKFSKEDLIARAKELKLNKDGIPLIEPYGPPSTGSPVPTAPMPAKYADFTPTMVGATAALIKLAFNKTEAEKRIRDAAASIGSSASENDLVNYALSGKPEPVSTTPPKPVTLPEPPKPEIKPEPVSITPKENPPSTENYQQQQLKKLNSTLSSAGLPTLDNVSQMLKLNSIKGGLKSQDPGKTPSVDKMDLWKKMIAKAKGEKLTEFKNEIVNPFVVSNFHY